jgi:hypothetical protein
VRVVLDCPQRRRYRQPVNASCAGSGACSVNSSCSGIRYLGLYVLTSGISSAVAVVRYRTRSRESARARVTGKRECVLKCVFNFFTYKKYYNSQTKIPN